MHGVIQTINLPMAPFSDLFFAGFASGLRSPFGRMWPPEGDFGSAPGTAWAVAGAGVAQAALIIVALWSTTVSVAHAMNDPMMIFLWLLLLPLLLFVGFLGLGFVAFVATASLSVLWGSRRAWVRALVSGLLSLLVGPSLLSMGYATVGWISTIAAVGQIAFLIPSRPKLELRA